MEWLGPDIFVHQVSVSTVVSFGQVHPVDHVKVTRSHPCALHWVMGYQCDHEWLCEVLDCVTVWLVPLDPAMLVQQCFISDTYDCLAGDVFWLVHVLVTHHVSAAAPHRHIIGQ